MPRDTVNLIESICKLGNDSLLAGIGAAKSDLRRRLAAIDRSDDPIEYASQFVGVVSDWLSR